MHAKKLDPETARPVHTVNYCVAMSSCDKCTDDCPWRIVLKFKHSVVSGAEMPSNIFACGRLMTRLTWRLSSLHTMTVTTIYISLCLIIYLIKVLQMYIKTCESKFIDSCCFLSMSLSKFSDTFSLPDVMKGTFPHCFNTPNNYGYVGLLPGMLYYDPDGP